METVRKSPDSRSDGGLIPHQPPTVDLVLVPDADMTPPPADFWLSLLRKPVLSL